MGIEPIDPDQNLPEKPDSSSTTQDKRAQIRAQISGVEGHYVTHSDAFDDGADQTNDTTKTGTRRTVAHAVATNEVERVMGIEPTSRFSS